MTRILHTSDWHLGKKLYKKERWPEQVKFLDWLVATIKKEEINILIIAGDIFDTPMPPTYALKGLFNFYKEIEEIESLEKVIVIGGNHDSGKLIETPTPLLGEKFEILGRPSAAKSDNENNEHWAKNHKVSYQKKDSHRVIDFALFPFFRASDILVPQSTETEVFPPDKMLLHSIEQWLKKCELNSDHYNIFIGHHLFGSFFESGSEQGVGLSGLSSLPLHLFEQWDLMCLGHIHKPQCLKKQRPLAHYSGSPIPMRFSEKEQKSVVLYDLEDHTSNKSIKVSLLPIPQFRPLIQVESTQDLWLKVLNEKMEGLKKLVTKDHLPPFLELTVHFNQPQPSYIDIVREEIKNLEIELLNYYQIVDNREGNLKEQTLDAKKIQTARMDELFDLYLEEQELESENKATVKKTYGLLMDEIKGLENDSDNFEENHP